MKKSLATLLLFLSLSLPSLVAAQSQGWFTRSDCSEITSPSSTGLRCLATATAGGFTANHVYRWSGSAWVDTGLATEIINTPAGNIAATTVQAAIAELDSEKLATGGNAATASALAANGANCSSGSAPLGVDAAGAVESCFDVATQTELDAHLNDTSAAHAGSAIANTPAGGIAADDVQEAINELDTEKLGATTLLVSTNIPKIDVLATSDHCADGGSTDTYACDLAPAVTSYVTGTHYFFKANTINTGAASINFNSVGAVTIVKLQGAINTTLANADIRAGQWVEVVYDGTNMQMVSASGNAASVSVPGSDTQVIYNDGGSLGADSGLLFNETTNVLSATGGMVAGDCATNCMTVDASAVTGSKTATLPNHSGQIPIVVNSRKIVQIEIFAPGVAATTGDGKAYFRIPTSLNGMNLVAVTANVFTAGTTGTINFDIDKCSAAATGNVCSGTVVDMLSTNGTIDSGENSTTTAAAALVISATAGVATVATGDILRLNVDAVHTTPSQGGLINMEFELP